MKHMSAPSTAEARQLIFHRDFGHATRPLLRTPRFRTAIEHSALLFRSNAVCTWLPKNGCTNIRYSLGLENGMIDSDHDPQWMHHNNTLFTPSLKDCYTAAYRFIFLRCPVERVVSAFLDKFVDSPETMEFRARFADLYPGEDVSTRLCFSDFVTRLGQGGIADHHWQDQADFLLYDRYDDYFDLKDFARARDTLRLKIDFDLRDTRTLFRHDLSGMRRVDIPRAYALPVAALAELRQNGLAPEISSLVSKDIAQQIRTIWQRDFTLYESHFGVAELWRGLGIDR